MKRNTIDDNEVTRGILREELNGLRKELKEEFRKYPTREEFRHELIEALKNHPTKDEFREYRSEMLTRLDQIVGDLAQMREDREFTNYEIRQLKATDEDHERRLTKIETS